MSTTTRVPRNGVNVPALFATVDVVRENRDLAKFQFRSTTTWVNGNHSRTTIQGFYGAGQEDSSRTEPFVYEADHPQVLVGEGRAASPVEFLLHAVAACLMAGLANVAAARGVTLTRVEATVEGDLDASGVLGLGGARNGYEQIRVSFHVEGDATDEQLRAVVEQSRNRSAVFDVLTNGVPVVVDVAGVPLAA